MNKLMKFPKVILTIVMLLCVALPTLAHNFEVNGIYYKYLDKSAKTVAVTYRGDRVIDYSNEYTGSVTIPSSVTYSGTTYSVTSIGYEAFYNCTGLTSVTIPNSVTKIVSEAFYNCTGLTSITIPNSVTEIGSEAFYGTAWYNNQADGILYLDNCCLGYKGDEPTGSLSLKEGTRLIGSKGFYNCDGLTSITIPNSVTSIGYDVFYGCSGLTSITIPNSVTSIGDDAFSGFTGLTSVTIPNSVTSIGSSAFSGCTGLTSVTIPNSVTSIGDDAFRDCSGLTSITIPNSVTSIGNSAFYDCSGLTSITIPNSVTSIGDYAFSGCTGLTSITIPNSVTSIGSSAFYNCIGLTEVNYNAENCTSMGLSSYPVFRGCSNLKTLNIGNEVKNIPPYAFEDCTGLTSVTIPNSVTSIGDYAFYNCTGLTKLILEDGTESISGLSFPSSPIETLYLGRITSDTFVKGKTTLKEVTIGKSVTSIGYDAFAGCSSLTSITIPNSVTSIGYCAFDGCTGLTEVNISDLSAWCKIDFGSSDANPLYYAKKFKLNGAEIKNLVIPNDITEIKNYVFSGCTGLTSVTIGSGISSIPSDAFSVKPQKTIWLTNTPPSGYSNVAGTINYVANDQYSSLSNIKVYPYLSSIFEVDGVKYVPVSPSERTCNAIDCTYNPTDTIINIGNTVTFKGVAMTVKEINPYICYGNSYIKECKIDYNGNILDYAFCGCSAIETITLGEGLGKIGNSAFSGCSKLKEVVIPNSATSLGESAFYSCSSITSATIGNAVKNINASTFYNCKSLENIIIGNGVKSIGENSFYGCSTLPIIEIPKNVTSIGDYAFDNCSNLSDVIIEDRNTVLTLGSNGSSPMFSDCPLDSVYIGGNISYKTTSNYGYSPFYNNKTLRAVTITDKETEISDNEFYGCANLKSVSIGNGVKTIGKYAFSGCASLESFAFGSSIKTIGEEAFSDCTALVKLRSKAMIPPICSTQALDDINKWNCELYVPGTSVSAYKAADQWKEFFFISKDADVKSAKK